MPVKINLSQYKDMFQTTQQKWRWEGSELWKNKVLFIYQINTWIK